MHESSPSWLRLLPIGLLLLLLAGAAGASLTVIHLRQEEAHLAAATAKLRGDYSETGRQLEEMTASVAAAKEPETVKLRVASRLQPVKADHIVWVRPGNFNPSMESRPAAMPVLTVRLAYNEPAARMGLSQ